MVQDIEKILLENKEIYVQLICKAYKQSANTKPSP
jgi:hypothetical protein